MRSAEQTVRSWSEAGSPVSEGSSADRWPAFDPTTGLADPFDTNPSGSVIVPIVSDLIVQSDGQVIVAGQFNNIGGAPRQSLARLNGTAGSADEFDPNPVVNMASIALQPDGKILAGGGFSGPGGQPRRAFGRLTNDTPALSAMTIDRTAITLTRAGAGPSLGIWSSSNPLTVVPPSCC